MIISISGSEGSGKSTIAKMLATKLGRAHYSIGNIWRQKAKEKGLLLSEYQKLAENDISLDLEVDEYNNVWATAGRGLLKYSNGLWYLYTANNSGLPGNGAVISISFEKHIKWIGTYNKGYVSFNDTNWVIYNSTNSGLPDDHTTNANYVDYQNNKWISTFMSGISMFNSKSNTWTNYDTYWPGLPDNYVDAILVQKNGLKWFGSSSGLTKYNDTNVVVYYANNFVYDVYRLKTDRYDNLWILGTYLTVHNPSQRDLGTNEKRLPNSTC